MLMLSFPALLCLLQSTSAVSVVTILPEREEAPNADVILPSSPMSAPIFVLRQRNVLRNLRCSSATSLTREHYGEHEGARRSFRNSFNPLTLWAWSWTSTV